MRESPRVRRLRSDLAAMQQLREESSILNFAARGVANGDSPESYDVYFSGRGLWKSPESGDLRLAARHRVSIQLGAMYPRMMPELRMQSPVFHPNISAAGIICLGGYSTHWVPSLRLDELCTMLWDMIRYENFDVDSPYNREAAQWVRTQSSVPLPLDARPLRDKAIRPSRPADSMAPDCAGKPGPALPCEPGRPSVSPRSEPAEAEILFMTAQVVEAELVPEASCARLESGILFLD